MLMTEYDYQTDIRVQREEAEEQVNRSHIKKLYQRGWSLSEIAKFVDWPEEDV